MICLGRIHSVSLSTSELAYVLVGTSFQVGLHGTFNWIPSLEHLNQSLRTLVSTKGKPDAEWSFELRPYSNQ